jgi:glutamine synthetase
MGEKQYITNPKSQKIRNLKNIISDFSAVNFIPKIGIELEFYLLNQDNSPLQNPNQLNQFIEELSAESLAQNINLLKIEKEQGVSQIEAKTVPYSDILSLCSDIFLFKKITKKLAKRFSLKANFEAQIFKDDCGSALQINLSLADEKNNYLFAKNESAESLIMLHSIGGILASISDLIIFCAPKKKDYLRSDQKFNQELFKKGKFTAPVNICWGYNNRTALVRIPSNKDFERRIEFRLASANADIYLIILSLLKAVKYGIENKINPPEALYGNAFDERYNILPLIKLSNSSWHL